MNMDYKKVLPHIYEGKANRLYEVEGHPEYLIIERKDDITAGNGAKHDTIEDKGFYNNKISNQLFWVLRNNSAVVPTHFVQELSDCETLIQKTNPIKLEIVVRNIATGSIIERLPFDDGQEFTNPIFELYYKDDALGDPLINHSEALALGVISERDYADIEGMALIVNDTLKEFFNEIGIILVDFKIEVGRTPQGDLIIIDEISPDTCRLWDAETRKKLDKDRFRQGLGDEAGAYREIYRRVCEQVFFIVFRDV